MPGTDSDPSTASLALLGVWVHDPIDPEGSAHQYPYGANARSTAIDGEPSMAYYAGREFPVADFGEFSGESYSMSLDVPHGPTWLLDVLSLQEFKRAKRTLMLRDNRGRTSYGIMSNYQESDQNWGTRVTFTFTRVDYTVA